MANSINQASQKVRTQNELTLSGNPNTQTVRTKDGTLKMVPANYVLYDEEAVV